MRLVEDEGNHSQYTRNADTDENEAGFAKVEAVERRVDYREDFEEGVVDAWKISSVCLNF